MQCPMSDDQNDIPTAFISKPDRKSIKLPTVPRRKRRLNIFLIALGVLYVVIVYLRIKYLGVN